MTESSCRWHEWLIVLAVLCLAGCSGRRHNGDIDEKTWQDVPVLRCPRTTESITVDGKADESSWKNVAAIQLVNNDGPETAGPPPLGTDVKLIHDETYLYAFFRCEDDHVRVDYHNHDDLLWNSYSSLELVELMLDPQGLGRDYFEINVNPDGVVLDVRVIWHAGEPSFDVGWNVEGLLVATCVLSSDHDIVNGWAVELGIPWSAVAQPPPEKGDTWRVNVYRGDGGLALPRLSWSATGIAGFHVPEKFGVVVFD